MELKKRIVQDNKGANIKLVSIFLSIVLIGLLIFSGPAEAFTLNIVASKNEVNLGEEIYFIASVNILPEERLPIDYLELEIGSPITCKFKPDGTIVSGCSDLDIVKLGSTDYTFGNRTGGFSGTEYSFGYGYGYSSENLKNLSYGIVLNSSVLGVGSFESRLKVQMIGNPTSFESQASSMVINPMPVFNLIVNEPREIIYNSKLIGFNLTTLEEAKQISYIEHRSYGSIEKNLCRNCGKYGETTKKTKVLGEGEKNITFRAIDDLGNIREENVIFFIDSKNPVIRKTEPVYGFTHGEFSIEFDELNPKKLELSYGNTLSGFKIHELDIDTDCILDSRYRCVVSTDLSDYNGEMIEYSFNLTDIAGNSVKSRSRISNVDLTPPVINSFNHTIIGNSVNFIIDITDENFDEISYVDHTNSNLLERRLCSTLQNGICNKRKSFGYGEHNLTINILDKAGNFIEKPLNFLI